MIIVFGSLNMDLVLTVPSIPRPGETVLCAEYVTKPGGKGCNQAVAAARAGARVAMAGRVGDDGFGRQLVDGLGADTVDTRAVARSDRPTGVAMICVEPSGENAIAVASGANLDADAGQLDDLPLGADSVLVLQMEVPPEQNWAAVERVKAAGGRAILNLAPAAPAPRTVLEALDMLVFNEIEVEMLAAEYGLSAAGPEQAARTLNAEFGATCVVTLGGRGALAVEHGRLTRVDSMAIDPVDTTGAGDAFTGVLAAAIDGGHSLAGALHRASVGAALACLALGAQESLPSAAAIAAHMDRVPPPRATD